jgi:hypothetical protein
MESVRIIQSSPEHTGSTLLLNLIHGFLEPEEKVRLGPVQDFLITKTHNINVDELMDTYEKYKLYFIMSERWDEKVKRPIPNKYRGYGNVLVIKYDDINETSRLSLESIVNNTFARFKTFLPKEMIPRKSDAEIKKNMIERIRDMNLLAEQIEDESTRRLLDFYGIHQHHRNRAAEIQLVNTPACRAAYASSEKLFGVHKPNQARPLLRHQGLVFS